MPAVPLLGPGVLSLTPKSAPALVGNKSLFLFGIGTTVSATGINALLVDQSRKTREAWDDPGSG